MNFAFGGPSKTAVDEISERRGLSRERPPPRHMTALGRSKAAALARALTADGRVRTSNRPVFAPETPERTASNSGLMAASMRSLGSPHFLRHQVLPDTLIGRCALFGRTLEQLQGLLQIYLDRVEGR